ncbi:MAG: class I SAM-dependent methyltransferase [Gemmatimonadales bacterium]
MTRATDWIAAAWARTGLFSRRRAASNTALGVLALRAAHQLIDGAPRILEDPVAVRLVAPWMIRKMIRYGEGERDRRVDGLRAHIVTRSRYTEDRLAEATARGTSQFVVLGAGFDTFAYRQPRWARGLRIFEVDHPASQEAKRARLARVGIEVPDNVTFVPIDFETTPLRAGLIAGGVALDRPTFFSWLGVLVYLEQAAIDAVFNTVTHFPAGSEIVFTFSPPDRDGAASGLARRVALMGEPWKTRLETDALLAQLRRAGFSDSGLVDPAELAERYFRDRHDDLPPPRRERLAWART